MPTRTAQTTWHGGLEDGTGTVELTSSGVGTYEVSFPKRAADDAGGTTSPEELIAAAHTACYAMQFSALSVRPAAARPRWRFGRTSPSAPTPPAGSGSPASS